MKRDEGQINDNEVIIINIRREYGEGREFPFICLTERIVMLETKGNLRVIRK